MKTLNLLTVLFLTFFYSLFVNIFPDSKTFSPSSKQSIVRYITQQGQYDYEYVSNYNIGRKDGSNGYYSGSQEDIYRSSYDFGISLPSNATITQVTLNYNVGFAECGTCKFKVVQISGTKSWGDLWGEIGSATAVNQDLGYYSSNIISSNLKNIITSSLSNGSATIHLGALSVSNY